jgi:hypothetical protein
LDLSRAEILRNEERQETGQEPNRTLVRRSSSFYGRSGETKRGLQRAVFPGKHTHQAGSDGENVAGERRDVEVHEPASGGAEGANLTADQGQLVFDMQFEFFQANFLDLLIFRKPGLLEQGFELFRIVTMLFFQATYCFTIRLTVRFQIHRRHLRCGITPGGAAANVVVAPGELGSLKSETYHASTGAA